MTGILAVFNDIPKSSEDDFNEWYNQQHVLERVGVPGFQSGRRYRGIDATHRYFAWYETAFAGVMKSTDYVQRLEDPTTWTARVMPGFENMVRTVCTRTVRAGEGVGGAAATLEINNNGANISPSIVDAVVEQAFGQRGVVSVEHWQADSKLSVNDTTESRMRQGDDKVIDGMLMIQGMDESALAPLRKELPEAFKAAGVDCAATMSTWQLLFSAT